MAIELLTLYSGKEIGCDLNLTDNDGNVWRGIKQLQDWPTKQHEEYVPMPMKDNRNIRTIINEEAKKILSPFVKQIGLNAEKMGVDLDGNIYINCEEISIGKDPIHNVKVSIFISFRNYGMGTPYVKARSEIRFSPRLDVKSYLPIALLFFEADPPTTSKQPKLLYDDRNARWLIDNVLTINDFLKNLNRAIEITPKHHLERIQKFQQHIRACPDETLKQIVTNQLAAYILTEIFQIPLETLA